MKSMIRMSDHNVYISHAWGGESEQIVQEIYKRCQTSGLNIIMDRQDLGYRESISSFMQNLGRADAIILVVSNKYLHSEYCMFELLQIYENKNMINRIFPVVLDEVSIAKSTDRLDLVKYWENETENLEAKIRELKNLSYIEGITDDLNLYQKIRNNIAKLTKILKDINTLNIRLHKDNDYNHLINAIESYIHTSGSPESDVLIPDHIQSIMTDQEANKQAESSASVDSHTNTNQSEKSIPASKTDRLDKKDFTGNWWSKFLRIWPVFLILGVVCVGLYLWFGDEMVNNDPGTYPSTDQLVGTDHTNTRKIVELSPQFPADRTSNKITIDQPKEINLKTEQANLPTNTKEEGPTATAHLPASKGENYVPQNIKETEENQSEQVPEVSTASTNENIRSDIEDKHTSSTPIEDTAQRYHTEKLYVPATSLSVRIPFDLSSNKIAENDVIYLLAQEPVLANGQTIVGANARVRTRIIDAKASYQGGRGALGIRLEAIETLDGQWLPLNYHDIVERRRNEVVFNSGTVLNDVKLESATINFKIFQ